MPDHATETNISDEGRPSHRSATRALWLAVILLAGGMVAGVVGVLFRVAGSDYATVLGATGAAFVSAVSLGFASWKFLSE